MDKATRKTMTLDRLALAESRDLLNAVESYPTISPADCRDVIVSECGNRYEILDGYHRIAGVLQWAKVHGVDLEAIELEVIEALDADLAAAASERDAEAIEALIEAS